MAVFVKRVMKADKPIFLDFPYVLYNPKWGRKSPKSGHFLSENESKCPKNLTLDCIINGLNGFAKNEK